MDITILSIKDQFLSAYQYASEKAGELAGHTVKAINQGVVIFNTGLGYVREDVRLAALTFAVVNIIIFELALGISILISNDKDESPSTVKSYLLLGVFSSILIGTNVALAKGLKTKLTPLTIFAISISCYALDIIFRFYLNKILHREKST